jgi:putative ABC transport system permease protein
MSELVRKFVATGRSLLRQPSFSVIVVLTLAVSLMACTTVYSLISAIFHRPLAYVDDSRVVVVQEYASDAGPSRLSNVHWGSYSQLAERVNTLDSLAAVRATGITLRDEHDPEVLYALCVTGNIWPMFRVRAHLGSTFSVNSVGESSHPPVVISHEFWSRRFNRSADAIGRTLNLDGTSYTIVGVTPPGFQLPGWDDRPLAYLPHPIPRTSPKNLKTGISFVIYGRMASGGTLAKVNAELERISRHLATDHSDTHAKTGYVAQRVRHWLIGDFKNAIWGLLASVVLLLCIACCNAANMILARAVRREKEVAIRLTVGARRRDLLRDVLMENLWMTGAAVTIGIALTHMLQPAVLSLLPEVRAVQTFNLAVLDWRVSAVIAGVFAILCSSFSALVVAEAHRLDIDRCLRERSPGGGGGIYAKLSGALVVVQVAMSCSLLIATLLLCKSVLLAENTPLGIDATKLLKFRVGVRATNYPTSESRANVAAHFEREFARLPGVEHVTLMHNNLPKAKEGSVRLRSVVNDAQNLPLYATDMVVGHAFIDTLGLRLHSGRSFGGIDHPASPPAVIISEELARLGWPGQDPVGQRVSVEGTTNVSYEIIGVVSDIRAPGPRPERLPMIFRSERQHPQTLANYILRAQDGDPRRLIRDVQRIIALRDPDTSLYQFETMAELYWGARWQSRFATWFLGFFALFALLLAGSGIYSFLSYTVAWRIPEFGLRIALGAAPKAILTLVLRRAFVLAGAGVVIGIAFATAVTRMLRGMLYNTAPHDSFVVTAASLLILALALAASLQPALRAVRTNPLTAMNCA